MRSTRKMVFENHVAIVTGASQGIGRAIALGLAAKEAMLFLVGRNTTALHEVTELARKSSPRVVAHATDLVKRIVLRQFEPAPEKRKCGQCDGRFLCRHGPAER